jgi:hypothetical protein
MRPTVTRNATHNFQKPANWDDSTDGPCGDLQVRAETFGDREIVELISTWKPSADELDRLHDGGVIEIGLCVTSQPPMRAYVVDPVHPVLHKYLLPNEAEPSGRLETPPITINEHAHGDDTSSARSNDCDQDEGA